MKIVTASLAALWLCLLFAPPAHSAEEFRGKWTLSPSKEHGKVLLGLTLKNTKGALSRHASNWPVTAFSVLDLRSGGKHEVAFVIDREIGRIECRGFIEGGEGAGAFTFRVSEQYLESMRSRGHDDIDESERFAMAVHHMAENALRASQEGAQQRRGPPRAARRIAGSEQS